MLDREMTVSLSFCNIVISIGSVWMYYKLQALRAVSSKGGTLPQRRQQKRSGGNEQEKKY